MGSALSNARKFIEDVWDFIGSAFSTGITLLIGFFALSWLRGPLGGLMNYFTGRTDGEQQIGSVLDGIGGFVRGLFGRLLDNDWRGAMDQVTGIFNRGTTTIAMLMGSQLSEGQRPEALRMARENPAEFQQRVNTMFPPAVAAVVLNRREAIFTAVGEARTATGGAIGDITDPLNPHKNGARFLVELMRRSPQVGIELLTASRTAAGATAPTPAQQEQTQTMMQNIRNSLKILADQSTVTIDGVRTAPADFRTVVEPFMRNAETRGILLGEITRNAPAGFSFNNPQAITAFADKIGPNGNFQPEFYSALAAMVGSESAQAQRAVIGLLTSPVALQNRTETQALLASITSTNSTTQAQLTDLARAGALTIAAAIGPENAMRWNTATARQRGEIIEKVLDSSGDTAPIAIIFNDREARTLLAEQLKPIFAAARVTMNDNAALGDFLQNAAMDGTTVRREFRTAVAQLVAPRDDAQRTSAMMQLMMQAQPAQLGALLGSMQLPEARQGQPASPLQPLMDLVKDKNDGRIIDAHVIAVQKLASELNQINPDLINRLLTGGPINAARLSSILNGLDNNQQRKLFESLTEFTNSINTDKLNERGREFMQNPRIATAVGGIALALGVPTTALMSSDGNVNINGVLQTLLTNDTARASLGNSLVQGAVRRGLSGIANLTLSGDERARANVFLNQQNFEALATFISSIRSQDVAAARPLIDALTRNAPAGAAGVPNYPSLFMELADNRDLQPRVQRLLDALNPNGLPEAEKTFLSNLRTGFSAVMQVALHPEIRERIIESAADTRQREQARVSEGRPEPTDAERRAAFNRSIRDFLDKCGGIARDPERAGTITEPQCVATGTVFNSGLAAFFPPAPAAPPAPAPAR